MVVHRIPHLLRKVPFKVNSAFFVISILALILTAWAYWKSPELALRGFRSGGTLFIELLPNLAMGFLMAGMIQVLLPKELVAAWAGEGSGLRGLLVGTLAGAATPGGPFFQFPVVAAMWKAGAGVGPMTAYLTAWALLGFQRVIIWEIPVLGWHFALARWGLAAAVPVILGWIMSLVYHRPPGV
ncbi:MAG: permease [Candidatus Lambdaproteobacteria bacterium]|nr:permease [Candidatus Lambdaproteobacteria bacterium]